VIVIKTLKIAKVTAVVQNKKIIAEFAGDQVCLKETVIVMEINLTVIRFAVEQA